MPFSQEYMATVQAAGMGGLMMAVGQHKDPEDRKDLLREFARQSYVAQQVRLGKPVDDDYADDDGPPSQEDMMRALAEAKRLAQQTKRTPAAAVSAPQASNSQSPHGSLGELFPVPSAQAGSMDGLLRYNGKVYVQLRPVERAALKQDDPALFARMRASAAIPLTYSQLQPAQRAALKREEPETYAAMQADPQRTYLWPVEPETYMEHLPCSECGRG